jgi:hypothetical protein
VNNGDVQTKRLRGDVWFGGWVEEKKKGRGKGKKAFLVF